MRGVAALLFCSGACALIYQVAWFRELRLIFGASTASSAAVLAIFMGGLGLGGALLGKRADRSPNPLQMYANLEIAAACAAGVTPALVWLADKLYLGAGGTIALGAVGATLLRILLSVAVLGPVTFLMGGTLPAAAKAIERDDDGPRRGVATLYGTNTLGAVTGVVLANFFLLEVLGTRMTLWMAALVNVLVGVVARSLARSSTPRAEPAAVVDAAPPSGAAPAEQSIASSAAATEPAGWFPPAAAALVGASFMLMELTWYRMLAPLLGGSSYTFGLILAVALFGIAVGGGIYARSKVPATLRWFAITCSLEALFIAIPYAVGDRLALVTALLRPLCRVGFAASTGVWTAVAAFVVLPAAIVSGIQFPLVIGLYGRGARGVGRDVGAAYLANTVGSIVGSLAGGFGLIPLLGALGSWKLVVVSLSVGATAAVLLDVRRTRTLATPRMGLGVLLAWLPSVLLLTQGPTAAWRHAGIGAGRADVKLEGAGPEALLAFRRAEQRTLRWEVDGVESSVALGHGNGFTFVVNGKADGHAIIDAPTQIMSGVLPALLHGNAKSSLIVGLGTGSTAGWLGAMPSMDRVDVVELEPAILRIARECAPVNRSVLDNPKVHIHLADAREFLRTTKSRYDIIFSEPSNPYRAGISSLYTVEYYHAAAERVAPGGLFVQWLQAYEVDGWVLGTAIVTLRQAFADVEVWRTMDGDLLLVARAEHKPLDVDRLRTMLATDPYAEAARDVWHTGSAEGILSHFVARSSLSDILVERGLGALNTDDQNFLEFSFARSVGRGRRVDADFTKLARRLGLDTPDVVGNVDARRVQDERWLFQYSQAVPLEPVPRGDLGAVIAAAAAGQHGAALGLWKKLGRERPESLEEASLLAEAAARAGGDADAALIDGARPADRNVLRAIRASRSGDAAAAAGALVQTFVAARTNPWIPPQLLDVALSLASDTAARAPVHAPALYESLREPFAVELVRDRRLVAAARVAGTLPDPATCVEAFEALEPPPWGRTILEQRAACYARAKHPRADLAQRELLEMLELDTPLGSSIPTPPRPRRPASDAPADAAVPPGPASGDP